MSSFHYCPVCGAEVASVMNFCRKCGTNLKEYEQAHGIEEPAEVAPPLAESQPEPQAEVPPAAAMPEPTVAESQPEPPVATPPVAAAPEPAVASPVEAPVEKAPDAPDIAAAFSGIGKGLSNLMGGEKKEEGSAEAAAGTPAPKVPAIDAEELKGNFINFFNLNVDSQLTAGEFDPNSTLLSNSSEQEVESAFAALAGLNYAQEEAAYLQYQVPFSQGQILNEPAKASDSTQQSLLAITEDDEKRERADDPLAQAMPKEWDLDFTMTGHKRGEQA